MHLFRSILNAHFLRYITLVVVACFGFCAHSIFHSTDINIYAAGGADPNVAITNTASATYDGGSVDSNTTTTNITATQQSSDLNLISVLNTAIGLVSLIYVPFSMLSSWLLSPDWTFGDFIHLRPVLHSLWIFVSNTVYVVFAAMLIVVAIANIFGQSDSYAIKKMLPRFIIGVIMVPFTWWIVSATLSVSSYMTALALRMPADIILQNNSMNTANVDMATNCSLNFDSKTNNKKIWSCDPPKPVNLAEYFLQSDGAYGIIPMYAYNVFKFNQLDVFKNILNDQGTQSQAEDLINNNPEDRAAYEAGNNATKSAMLQAAIIATSIGKIGIQLMMSVIFAIVFVVILIALVLVLFTRVIKMWMYAIFSPLFALRYFLSDKIDKDNALSKFDFKEFIGLAMVPVVVSAALGFGFMFIMTFKSHMEQPAKVTEGPNQQQKGIDSPFLKDVEGTATGGTLKFFGTTIKIVMSADNSNGVGAGGETVAADNLKAALFNVLSGLITPIFGIVILWMAVMAAIKTSAVAGKAVEGIEKLGGEAVGMAKKLPNFIPVGSVKTKDGSKVPISIGGLKKLPDILQGEYQKIDDLKRTQMRQAMGFEEGKFEKINKAITGAGGSIEKTRDAIVTLGDANLTRTDMMSDTMREKLNQYAKITLKKDLKFDDANFDTSMKEIFDDLNKYGKLETGTTLAMFLAKFKQGGKEFGEILKDSPVPVSTFHEMKVTSKTNVSVTRQSGDTPESIAITAPDLTGKSDSEKKALLKTALEEALKAKKLSFDDPDGKKKLDDLADDLLAESKRP